MADPEIRIETFRFASERSANRWLEAQSERQNFRRIKGPYSENKLEYAPIAVDCEIVVPKRHS